MERCYRSHKFLQIGWRRPDAVVGRRTITLIIHPVVLKVCKNLDNRSEPNQQSHGNDLVEILRETDEKETNMSNSTVPSELFISLDGKRYFLVSLPKTNMYMRCVCLVPSTSEVCYPKFGGIVNMTLCPDLNLILPMCHWTWSVSQLLVQLLPKLEALEFSESQKLQRIQTQ